MDKITDLLNKIHNSTPAKNFRDPKSTTYFIKIFKEYGHFLTVLGVFIALATFFYSVDLGKISISEDKVTKGLFLTSLSGLRFFSLLIALYLSIVFLINLFQNLGKKYNVYYPMFTLLILLFLGTFYMFFFTINANIINQIIWFIAGISLAFFLGFRYHKLKDKYLPKIKYRSLRISVRIILSFILILLSKNLISTFETAHGLKMDGTLSNFGFFIFNVALLFLMIYLIGDLLLNVGKIFKKV